MSNKLDLVLKSDLYRLQDNSFMLGVCNGFDCYLENIGHGYKKSSKSITAYIKHMATFYDSTWDALDVARECVKLFDTRVTVYDYASPRCIIANKTHYMNIPTVREAWVLTTTEVHEWL